MKLRGSPKLKQMDPVLGASKCLWDAWDEKTLNPLNK